MKLKKHFTPFSLLVGLGCATASLADNQLPNYSAFANQKPLVTQTARSRASSLVDHQRRLHTEERLGVPSFLWADSEQKTRVAKTSSENSDIEKIARQHLNHYAALYRLDSIAESSIQLHHIQELKDGGAIVKFTQKINDVDVVGRSIRLLLDKSFNLTAISGYLSPHVAQASADFSLTMPEAISKAFADLHQQDLPVQDLQLIKNQDDYQWFSVESLTTLKHQLAEPIRVKKVFYNLSEDLESAYYIELSTVDSNGNQPQHYAYVISAVDGRLLSRQNLVHFEKSQPFTYRVWAGKNGIPYDSPYGNNTTPYNPDFKLKPVESRLVSVGCDSDVACDPWLKNNATQLAGNNAKVYSDIFNPWGFDEKEFIAETTSPFTFDYEYDFALKDNKNNPSQLKSAMVQAFYTVNFMHDWLYKHGFDEKSGNAQKDNYGRGGEGSDRMRIEINDHFSVNNASMRTHSDGRSPVMQMGIWKTDLKRLTLKLSTDVTKKYTQIATADFGPNKFDLKKQAIVVVNDGTEPTEDACEAPLINANELINKIALIDRGDCFFTDKVMNAQNAGAVGVIIANNVTDDELFILTGDGAKIQIPTVAITKKQGEILKQALKEAATSEFNVTASLLKKTLPSQNSALDNSVVIHEWGHYLSDRLIGNLENNQGNSLSEGWSDFLANVVLSKKQDRLQEGNELYQGAYTNAVYANRYAVKGKYFGTRRYPYSTDMSINPLTFKHISNDVELPISAPMAKEFDTLENSEVHNSGEVWALMLWEAYVELLNNPDYRFKQAQNRMLGYLVASLKMTPEEPTFLEARDALLAVAKNQSDSDYQAFWRAFAKRGAGVNAVAPKRFSKNHSGVIEDFSIPE